MFKFFKKADADLQQDVMTELRWDPSVTATQIGVTVTDGIVTLRGTVPHYHEKICAEDAAQRVGGVRAIADELEVNIEGVYERTDEDIARAALSALEWSYQVPKGLKVKVEKGWVTLKGSVEWDYQRTAAHDAVTMLLGVRGVSNDVSIKMKVKSMDVKTSIQDALKRSAESEGRGIHVSVDHNQVTLSGNVHSFADIEVARLAAWNAPGVTNVTNELRLSL